MCYNQSMALHTYTRLMPTCVRWSRKLNCPTKFHAGHLTLLQRRVFGALAEIPPALSSVVTMTSDSQKSRRGRFYGSSGLHLNDQSSAALVKPKAFHFSSKILQSVSNETLQYVFLQNQFEPSVCVCVCAPLCVFQWTTFFFPAMEVLHFKSIGCPQRRHCASAANLKWILALDEPLFTSNT